MIYLLIVNVIGFLLFGIDKYKAIHQNYRISEKALFMVELIGGAYGAYAAMYLFHHKTRKPKFKIGVPTILIIQLVIIYFLFSGNEEVYSVINEILQMFNL